ncbi:hypothetical protein [Endozoicomonas sp. 2B-B]
MKAPIIIFGLVVSLISPVKAANVSGDDISKAQSNMSKRLLDEAYSLTKKMDISEEYVIFCNLELYLHTYQHPVNGQLPFGINYKSIKTSESLQKVIYVREVYERSFMKLCLSKAKNELKGADTRP